jgi:IS30 family transposase
MNLFSSTKMKERSIGMGQRKGSRNDRRNKHLNWEERIQIETLQREGLSNARIGERLGRPEKTIRREIQRGWVLHRVERYRVEERYSAVRGQEVYERRMKAKGRKPLTNAALAEHLHLHIVVHRQSPEVVAGLMRKDGFEHAVCFKTIYNHIDKGLVPGVSNESLWEKRKRRKGRKTLHRRRKRAIEPGHGIEDRPEEVEERLEAGHWEIDLVVGGKGKGTAVLLTLTERKTRKQIIRKLKNRTQRAVVRAINGIERQMGSGTFRTVFKSITADNGSEFLAREALEHSLDKGKRTHIYYAHPYAGWERGSNENANRIIRRFIPKGCDISSFTRRQIQKIEDWINNYPRKIFDFETAEERFIREMAA